MLDKLHIFIPFRSEFVTGGGQFLNAKQALDAGHCALVNIRDLNLPLMAKVCIDAQGQYQVDELRHSPETLPTSFTGMGMYLHNYAEHYPGVELRASPAKILQGHNVFGSTDISSGAFEMLAYLSATYPDVYDRLDVTAAQIWAMDCTYSSRMPSEQIAKQVISFISHVSSGQTKSRGDGYETTAYFGKKNSRLRGLKIYLKEPEFAHQFSEMQKKAISGDVSAQRVFNVMSNPSLIEWTKNLLRMEATVKKRWLQRRNIPINLFDLIRYQKTLAKNGRCLIRECWQNITAELFKAFEGVQMKITDDSQVLDALKAKYSTITKSGNKSFAAALSAFRTYDMIREHGWLGGLERMSKSTIYRHVEMLANCGVTKAYLQNLEFSEQANNVLPLIRFVNVEFSAQRPDWYQEPVSTFNQLTAKAA